MVAVYLVRRAFSELAYDGFDTFIEHLGILFW